VTDVTAYIEQFGPWLLVFNRVLGVFMFTPLLASGIVPMRFKALLGAAFAAGSSASFPRVSARCPMLRSRGTRR
jgi:flagellar biosynthesis protein FliR